MMFALTLKCLLEKRTCYQCIFFDEQFSGEDGGGRGRGDGGGKEGGEKGRRIGKKMRGGRFEL